jgi:hypothetical protein
VKRQRYSEEQIIGILKEAEAGVPLADLVRKHGISSASFYCLGRPTPWCPNRCPERTDSAAR